jgi:hypothetical protein
VGDEIFTANNDGQSASKTLIAALFGPDAPTSDTQLASATSTTTGTAPTTQQAGLLQTPATQSPILQMPDFSQAATVQTAAAPETTETPAATSTAIADNSASKGLPLDRSKQPYGGVMDSSMMQNAQQNQTLALAMAGQQGIIQAQRVLRNNRFAVATPATAAATVPTATAQTPTAPETQAALQNLLKELHTIKGVNSYQNAAQSSPVPGGALNITN